MECFECCSCLLSTWILTQPRYPIAKLHNYPVLATKVILLFSRCYLAQALSRAAFGQGTGPIYLDDVRCMGNELNITSCNSLPVGQHNCIHFEDAGVRCTLSPTTPPGMVFWDE